MFDIEGFIRVWCRTVEMPCAGRKCSPTGRLFHLQELYGREGGFQCNIYSDLFLSLARGPWEKTGEDKQWTIGFRDEQWCQRRMCHYGMWLAEGWGVRARIKAPAVSLRSTPGAPAQTELFKNISGSLQNENTVRRGCSTLKERFFKGFFKNS